MRLSQEQVQERQRLEAQGLRYCRSCSSTLPLEAFTKGKSSGYQTYCRKCNYSKQKESIAKLTPAEYRSLRNGQQQRRRARHGPPTPEQNRRANLRKYGITPEDYDQMFEVQQGLCAICAEASDLRLHIDHDHETGKVRGLLCARCNPALGAFRDSPVLLQAAINYLRLW